MDTLKFLDRVEELCSQKGLKRQVVYTNCGIGKNFGVSIRNGSEPSIGKVFALATELDCSVDYLLCRTDNPNSHTNKVEMSGLDKNERKILSAYRELNDEGKQQALIYVTEFLFQSARFTQKSDTDADEKAE